MRKVMLHAEHVKKSYPIRGGVFYRKIDEVLAVDDVSFDIYEGEVFGVVGESGSGKSTLGRLLIGLELTSEGNVTFEGKPVATRGREYRDQRNNLQIIFQDPFDSLDPRMTLGNIVAEGYRLRNRVSKAKTDEYVGTLLEKVGLDRSLIRHYPHEFSGGQRQRIGIARALSMHPRLIVCDEPVSALDVSVQAQILNLLNALQKEENLTMVFIAHGLNVVKYICDRVAVMYLGQMLEIADTETIFEHCAHPYTKMLLRAVPMIGKPIGKADDAQESDAINAGIPKTGCRFHPRCPYACQRCVNETPKLVEIGHGHSVACFTPLTDDLAGAYIQRS